MKKSIYKEFNDLAKNHPAEFERRIRNAANLQFKPKVVFLVYTPEMKDRHDQVFIEANFRKNIIIMNLGDVIDNLNDKEKKELQKLNFAKVDLAHEIVIFQDYTPMREYVYKIINYAKINSKIIRYENILIPFSRK